MVTVVAICKAKPGMEARVRAELMALVEPTRAEEGCVNYDLHASAEEDGLFMFYENWRSREDLEAHLERPHLVRFHGLGEELMAGPAEVRIFEMLSPLDQ